MRVWTLAAATAALCVGYLSNIAYALPPPVTDEDYYFDGAPSPAKVALGKMLFFDKIMSGNKNISCATCHSPLISSADNLSLGVGEGGRFNGVLRTTGENTSSSIQRRIARQAPALFNLGAEEFIRMNWGGIHESIDGVLVFPGVQENPGTLDNVLAAQALFPIVNLVEMVGTFGENDVANLVVPGTGRFSPLWNKYLERLKAIPEYVTLFNAAYPDLAGGAPWTIAHYANAVAAFEAVAFRSDNSPFDRYLLGKTSTLSTNQKKGVDLFYGKANCGSCHSGPFQTDQNFYAIAVPDIGLGPNTDFPHEDIGRMEKTNLESDRHKFRVPSLRNITYTAPYGHSGAFATLDAMIRHHLDSVNSLNSWDRTQVVMPSRSDLNADDFVGYDDPTLRQGIADANQITPVVLTNTEIKYLIDFLGTLTDPKALDLRSFVPSRVPSGLPVGD